MTIEPKTDQFRPQMRDLIAERTERLRQLIDRSSEAEVLALLEGLAAGMWVAMTAKEACAAEIARMRDKLSAYANDRLAAVRNEEGNPQ